MHVTPELETRIRDRLMQLAETLERLGLGNALAEGEPRFDPYELVTALGKQLNRHPARQWKDGTIDCETCSHSSEYGVRWPCEPVAIVAEAVGVDTRSC